jgi:hypothetical protein
MYFNITSRPRKERKARRGHLEHLTAISSKHSAPSLYVHDKVRDNKPVPTKLLI